MNLCNNLCLEYLLGVLSVWKFHYFEITRENLSSLCNQLRKKIPNSMSHFRAETMFSFPPNFVIFQTTHDWVSSAWSFNSPIRPTSLQILLKSILRISTYRLPILNTCSLQFVWEKHAWRNIAPLRKKRESFATSIIIIHYDSPTPHIPVRSKTYIRYMKRRKAAINTNNLLEKYTRTHLANER